MGDPGQFDVFADGQLIASRGGSLLAKLFGGGWPNPDRVVETLRSKGAAGASR